MSVTSSKNIYDVTETFRLGFGSKTAGIAASLSSHFDNIGRGFKKNVLNTFSGVTHATAVFAFELSKTMTPNLSVSQSMAGSGNLQEYAYGSVNSEQKVQIAKELYGYTFLEPGWDGPDSVRPSTSAIADASEFVWRLPINANLPEPTVYADGQVGWYWRKGDDVLSVVFSGDRKYAYYGNVKGEVPRSPTRQFSSAIPVELYTAISNL